MERSAWAASEGIKDKEGEVCPRGNCRKIYLLCALIFLSNLASNIFSEGFFFVTRFANTERPRYSDTLLPKAKRSVHDI